MPCLPGELQEYYYQENQMSIEYYGYTAPKRAYRAEELARLMKTMNWEIRFLDESEKISFGTVLDDDCYVVGWESSSPDAAELEKITDFSDEDQLTPFFERESLGFIEICVDPEYSLSEELTPDEIEEFQEDLEEEIFEKISSATFYAGTRTAAGRSERSHELQYFLLYALCLLQGGVLEDEIQGEYLDLEWSDLMPDREAMGF